MVIVVVSVSFHHLQCDSFHKIQQENAKWTGGIIYMWRFIVFLLSRALYKGHILQSSEGQRTMSTAKWKVYGPVDVGHSEKLPSSEALEENEVLDTWPLDVGQSVCRCDNPG
jgi:hypothetical protein